MGMTDREEAASTPRTAAGRAVVARVDEWLRTHHQVTATDVDYIRHKVIEAEAADGAGLRAALLTDPVLSSNFLVRDRIKEVWDRYAAASPSQSAGPGEPSDE